MEGLYMTRIKIDDWTKVHYFHIDVLVIPRIGEQIMVHKSACGEEFFIEHQDAFSGNYGCFRVVDIQHVYGNELREVDICVEAIE
jgi:hypothetical protein